jgi:hypothetical protein
VKSSDLSVGMEVAYAWAAHELRGGSLSRGTVVAVRVAEAWPRFAGPPAGWNPKTATLEPGQMVLIRAFRPAERGDLYLFKRAALIAGPWDEYEAQRERLRVDAEKRRAYQDRRDAARKEHAAAVLGLLRERGLKVTGYDADVSWDADYGVPKWKLTPAGMTKLVALLAPDFEVPASEVDQ